MAETSVGIGPAILCWNVKLRNMFALFLCINVP